MKRIISILMVLLMLASMLVACGGNASTDNPSGSKPQGNNGGESSDVKSELGEVNKNDVDENGYQNDRLPKAIDYEGLRVSLMTWETNEALTYPAEPGDGGDPIQQALYYHWRALEERLGIEFAPTWINMYYTNMAGFYTAARAEDAAYDLIQTESLFPTTLAQEGRLANLRNMTYPDLEMPWWPDSVNEFTQYGALFFIGSNSSANSISNLAVIFANRQKMEEEGLGDPVKLALRGLWTVDEMIKYSKQFAGLAEANPGEIYGFYCDHESRMGNLYFASGFSSTRNNANGVAELAFDNAETMEKISDAVDKYVILMTGPEASMSSGGDDAQPMYEEKTAMLLGFMHQIRLVENPEIYAPLPLPKLNNNQEKYRIVHRDCTDVWCVPITTLDKEMCGIILEANASSEYRTIAPFYFDQYLVKRYASDADGMKCFELIRNSVIYDFGYLSGCAIGSAAFRISFQGIPSNEFMSEYGARIQTARNKLAEILASYQKYAGQ